jgi:hypothetical protein
MSGEYRSVPDRHALEVGVRVQLSWVQYEPYTRHADMKVADRLAIVVGEEGRVWHVRDESGDEHHIADADLGEVEPDPARGRWRIEGAIPAYALGERLRLHWRHRSSSQVPNPPRDDCEATVIAEQASTVSARLDSGKEIVLYRWGFQADERNRQAARWFVVGRL